MNKPIPQRMCISCREMSDKNALVRVVKTKDDEFKVDTTGKMSGRGAYVHTKSECVAKLKKTKMLNKAFKCAVPDEIYEELAKVCNEKN